MDTVTMDVATAGDAGAPPAKQPHDVDIRPANVRAGRVVSTAGSQVIVLLDRDIDMLDGVRMGSLVSLRGPGGTVYGVIEGLSTPMPLQTNEGSELKMAEVGLLGEVLDRADGKRGNFQRGVSRLPSLDAEVHIADHHEAEVVYALPNRPSVCIGTVHQDPRVLARVGIDDLLGKHFAMLGTTGTGKSCAMTLVLKRILEQNPNGHILLLDPHGEYGMAFGARAELLSAANFRLPHWLFNFEEFVEVVFGHEKPQMQTEIMHLRELIVAAKTSFAGAQDTEGWITVDSPVPYTMAEVNRLLDKATGSLDNQGKLGAYMRVKARLNALQTDRRYAFIFDTGIFTSDNFAPLLGRLFRVPADGRPLAILNLVSVPSELLNVVVAVVCRLAFDFAILAGQRTPLLLVCEEAHRYAPLDAALGFEPAKRALARIAKEGRKHGISLGIVSQRPSELDPTILSQCNSVFAFRMSNERDQEIMHVTMPEASQAMFAALPFLGNSEAIGIGEGVPVPMRLRFADMPEAERPRSATARFSERWQTSDDDSYDQLTRVVEAMRGQKAT